MKELGKDKNIISSKLLDCKLGVDVERLVRKLFFRVADLLYLVLSDHQNLALTWKMMVGKDFAFL